MEILKSIYFEYSQTEEYARANEKYDKYYSAIDAGKWIKSSSKVLE